MARATTVRHLATSLGLDVDDVLIALWDAGFVRFERPSDVVHTRELPRVQKALSLPTARDIKSPSYWMQMTSTSPTGFAELMGSLGFPFAVGQKTLPKGAIRKLQAHVRSAVSTTPRSVGTAPTEEESVRSLDQLGPLEPWQLVGSTRQIAFLNVADVEDVHFALAKDFQQSKDPIFPAGVRDMNLLESAVERPRTSLGSTCKYPSVEMAGAALLHSLVLNHAFHNGNKRTGLVSILVFLDRNNFLLTCTDKELFQLVLRLADHGLTESRGTWQADDEVMVLSRWLHGNSRPIDKTERPMQWRRLKTILAHYDCAMEFTGRNNCIDITRTIELPPMLFQRERRTKVLRAQTTVTGDGMEISRKGVAKLRRQLELDEPHGVDSKDFYDDKPLQVDEWITKYRRILELLARL